LIAASADLSALGACSDTRMNVLIKAFWKGIYMTELRVIRKTQCGGCKKYFVGESAFFARRTGEYNRRRCLSTEEMIAQGYASERLLVKMYLENKPIREEHDV